MAFLFHLHLAIQIFNRYIYTYIQKSIFLANQLINLVKQMINKDPI